MIGPQTSANLVGGHGMSVDHVLAMAFDDPTMDDDLRVVLAAHEIVLGDEWADGRPRLGLVRVTEVDEGLEQRPRTEDAVGDVKKNWGTWRPIYYVGVGSICQSWGMADHFLAHGGVPLRSKQESNHSRQPRTYANNGPKKFFAFASQNTCREFGVMYNSRNLGRVSPEMEVVRSHLDIATAA